MQDDYESKKLKRLRCVTFSVAIILGFSALGLFILLESITRDLLNNPGFPSFVVIGVIFGIPFIILGVTTLYWSMVGMVFSFGLTIIWICITTCFGLPLFVLIIAFAYCAIGILNLVIWQTKKHFSGEIHNTSHPVSRWVR